MMPEVKSEDTQRNRELVDAIRAMLGKQPLYAVEEDRPLHQSWGGVFGDGNRRTTPRLIDD